MVEQVDSDWVGGELGDEDGEGVVVEQGMRVNWEWWRDRTPDNEV